MRGRVRLSVPALCRNRGLAEKLLDWLRLQSGVRNARVNYDCASLVLEYDPAQEPVLLALLERFKSLSLSEVKAFCAQRSRMRRRRSRRRCPRSRRWRFLLCRC